MPRLIDATALHRELVSEMVKCMRMSEETKGSMAERVLNRVDEAPTIEAEPVKHGRWEDFSSIWECDQCHKWFSLEQGTADMNYCPNCGAKMDGGAE